MSLPILATKLYIPRLRDRIVKRTHLIKRLRQDEDYRLILISAPAGFGKTSLVSEWLTACGYSASWLSLDVRDNDLRTFLTYFITGLQRIDKGIGSRAMEVLSTQPSYRLEAVLNDIINEIASLSYKIVYVLDDYHVISNREINTVIEYLLDYMPTNMQLVILTRQEPQLPIANLRAKEQLLELRDTDLRFTQFEIAQFVNRMNLNITDHNLKILEKHTEGWIAGIQLAALSMQNNEDISDFMERFSAGHTYIMDYLIEEVLLRQTEELQSFLLKTSILDRFCGELCDAVLETKAPSSQRILEQLQASNLFLVSLDNERIWFRYHHLFAELLRRRAGAEEALSQEIGSLHIRAANWFEEKGFMDEAIRHNIAIRAYEKASVLIEREWYGMDQNLQSMIWLGWAKLLPVEMLQCRPVLCTGYAWALLDAGELEGCEPMLQYAEKGIDIFKQEEKNGISHTVIVVDDEQYQKLPATIAKARAYKASAMGDIKGAIRYAKQSLELLSQEEFYQRNIVKTLLGLSLWASGDLDAAYTTITQDLQGQQMEIMVAVVLAEIRMEQGKFHLAHELLERALRLAVLEEQAYQLPIASFYLGLAKINFWKWDISAALELLEQSRVRGEKSALPNWKYQWLLLKAQIKDSQELYEEALSLITEAQFSYHRNPIPELQPYQAVKARIYLKQGNIDFALDLAKDIHCAMSDEPEYTHIYEQITLIRIGLKEYERHKIADIEQVIASIEHLLSSVRIGKWNRNLTEILILRAIAYSYAGKHEIAKDSIYEALRVADSEGYIQPFIEDREQILSLFSEINAEAYQSQYLERILQAIYDKAKTFGEKAKVMNSVLIEPLSERELELLYMISEGYSNQEICDRLYLALSTVKGYNQNLFGKLQVKSRTEAIKRARELGIL